MHSQNSLVLDFMLLIPAIRIKKMPEIRCLRSMIVTVTKLSDRSTLLGVGYHSSGGGSQNGVTDLTSGEIRLYFTMLCPVSL